MYRLILLCIAFGALIIAGCSEPVVDAATESSTQRTLADVRASLPDDQRQEFDDAVQLLMVSQIDVAELLVSGADETDSIEARMRAVIHGKTANEIISEARRLREERQRREREQALLEILELEEKRANAESARSSLAAFEVLRSRFYVREERFSGRQPIIEMTVRNGTAHAISRAYFEGTLASPGRSVPWHKDAFNYSIPGGLEPGEEAIWNLAPNMFSDWGRLDFPDDAVFTVVVQRLDDAAGNALYSTRSFTEHDLRRLEELRSQYGIE
ncbi:MAG: hypothetical protein JJT85_04660 [Chromatiales bacterium]|nr:hypothetical protein [Chromatiales bacterium]